jgi:hypothetical protein
MGDTEGQAWARGICDEESVETTFTKAVYRLLGWAWVQMSQGRFTSNSSKDRVPGFGST